MAVTKIPVINAQLDKMNSLLAMMVEEHVAETSNWDEIGELVRKGLAQDVFSIGDQLVTKWTDTVTGTEYTVPMDIVHFGDVELSDGETVPGMFLQWHYCTPFGVQFDACEALYYCDSELAAGTYYFTAANSWGSNIVSGESYYFTLANAVPKGGQLVLSQGCVDTAFANWKISSYASASTATATETVSLTKGTSGTSLGSWSSSTKYASSGINNMQRSNYGYNRWSQSGIRQFLNSSSAKSAWWSAQNVYDRAPSELQTKNGFLTGFSDDFLAQIKPIKILTALNTVSDSDIGAYEYTYDKFFLASKTNEFLNEQYAEGEAWEYWKRANNGVKPADYTNYAAPITYAVENHASAQAVRLRSANRGYACYTWNVNSYGYVGSNYATNSNRFAPACVIC